MVRLSILILSIVFTLGLSSMLAYSHTDNEDIVNSFSCEIEERDNPSDAEANWWWCYDETDFEEVHELKNGAFSLSMTLDVFDEAGTTLVVSCSGEVSTKDFLPHSNLDNNSKLENLDEACPATGGDCDDDQFDCHVTDVDAEEVICPPGETVEDTTCLDAFEACDEVADERDTEGNEGSIVWTGDVKALHVGTGGPNGNASSGGGGGGLEHHKAIDVDCPEES